MSKRGASQAPGKRDTPLLPADQQADDMLDAMLSNSQDHVFLVNERGIVERYWGPADESDICGPWLVGQEVRKALPEEVIRISSTAVRNADGGAKPAKFEYRMPTKDGGWRYYFAIVKRLKSGRFLSVCRDVTSPLEAEESRRKSEELLRHVTDAVPGGVYQYRFDKTGKDYFVFASPGIGELFGLEQSSLYKDLAPVWARIHSDDVPPLRESIIESYQTLEPWTFEFRVRRNEREDYRWIRGISRPLPPDENGAVTWNGFLYDVTDQKVIQDHLIQSQKLESVGTLASGVAHDFNNVLLAIANSNDLAQRSLPADHPSQRPLETVAKACQHARQVVRSLLTFSRRSMAERRVVDLRRLIRETRELITRVVPANVAVIEDVPEDGSAVVIGDHTQLQQVLMNMAMNARDAMPKGGTLTLRLRREANGKRGKAGTVRLTIEDTGKGIAPDHLEKIFEPFFTTKPRGEGTGLGLSVVHGIVIGHGGTIDVESQPGRGAKFEIALPAGPAAAADQAKARGAQAPVVAPGAHVLVAMDDATVRGILRAEFTDSGVPSTGVRTADAVSAIRDRRDGLDAVVVEFDGKPKTLNAVVAACAGRSHATPIFVLAPKTRRPASPPSSTKLTWVDKPYNPSSLVRSVLEVIAMNQEARR